MNKLQSPGDRQATNKIKLNAVTPMIQHHYTSKEIRQKIYSVVSEVSGIEISELNTSHSISDDIAPSSLDRVTLFMALEDEFSTSVAEDELEGIDTLEDLIRFVERKANMISA